MFNLGGKETYAIDALKVREIIKETSLNKIPGSSDVVSGCLNFRGSTIPVIDLPKLLFGTEIVDSMIIVMDSMPYGMRVSMVTQIAKMDVEFDERAVFSRKFVDGVFLGEDGSLIQMLNIEKIIAFVHMGKAAA